MEPIINHRRIDSSVSEAELLQDGDRVRRYRKGAKVVADVVQNLGCPVSAETREQWSDFFARLSVADAISERQPKIFGSGEALVRYLEIPENDDTVDAAQRLLEANARSIAAPTIDEHLDARRDEALATVDLLQLQSTEVERGSEAYDAIVTMGVSGIYLDSVLDAAEDSKATTELSVSELRRGASARLISEIRGFDRSYVRALLKAGYRSGLVGHLFARSFEMPRDVFLEINKKFRGR